MPTITTAEIAIVAAAVLLLYVAPFVLTLLDGSRRRQAQEWTQRPFEEAKAPADECGLAGASHAQSGTGPSLTNMLQQPAAEPSTGSPQPVASSTPAMLAVAATEPSITAPHVSSLSEGAVPEAAVESVALRTSAREVMPPLMEPTAPSADALRFAGYEPPAATPFHGSDGYRFRVEDLHRVRLADWPPESVLSDPARRQLWSEAVRLAAAHDATISKTDLVAPNPVRSACLGACERRATGMTLHFLLFPDLWPVAPEQALARVLFEIDSGNGAIRHSVDTLHPPA